jgi:uncharacterized membrane protein
MSEINRFPQPPSAPLSTELASSIEPPTSTGILPTTARVVSVPAEPQGALNRAGGNEPLAAQTVAATTESPPAAIVLNIALQRIAVVCLFGLFFLCLLWEIWLAPLKPGGTLLFLKALPLAFAMRGTLRGSLYTIQWASMLVLLYLMEGVVRVMSDPPGPSIALAWGEIILATGFFFSSVFYVRPAKKVAKALQKAEKVKR